jgi:hypothetical protein
MGSSAKIRWGLVLRAATLLLAVFLPLSAANIRLYLKEGGGDVLVREYEINGDRVRYYSIERSQWEEIPVSMVDLEKTQRIEKDKEAASEARHKEDSIERAAERRARTELHKIPIDDGVYYLNGDQVETVKQAEVKTDSSKSRTLLKVIAPVPIPEKETVELEGKKSEFVVTNDRPMFYMRLESINRFDILRLKDKKGNRLVQTVNIVPQSKERMEEQEAVEIFRQEFAPGVYKIWPTKPLPAGEYAVVEYTPGEADIRVWDFSCQPTSPSSATEPETPSPDTDKDP